MYSRHDLAWLTPEGWRAAIAAAGAADLALLQRWAQEDWPLVVTRRAPDAAPGTVCLGLAAPPQDGQKRRVALRALEEHIARTQEAMPLADIDPLPTAWEPALSGLSAASTGLDLRVFGSLALQTITGLAYVSPGSDIDLLFHPAGRRQLDAGLALLRDYQEQLPLDGEIVFPGGAAVAWREWAGAAASGARVLVKEHGPVRLATVESLLHSLAP